jgi:hypothetical protein
MQAKRIEHKRRGKAINVTLSTRAYEAYQAMLPEGIHTQGAFLSELILMELARREERKRLDANGKLILAELARREERQRLKAERENAAVGD